MIFKIVSSVAVGLTLLFASPIAQAANVLVTEAPTFIRFEQYTGNTGTIVFWRLPTPGVSTFPSSACLNLTIASDKPEQASRFMALYLFAKSNSKNIFLHYNPTTCLMVSFGMDG